MTKKEIEHPWIPAQEAGVPHLLRRAALIIKQRGWSPVPGTYVRGKVDLKGALGLAAKVPAHRISEDVRSMSEHAPQRQGVLLLTAWELLDSMLGRNPIEWDEDPNRKGKDVVDALEELARLLDYAY